MNEVIHKVYKIRHKETGLFSKGGTHIYGIWTKEGKSWSNIGHLKNHLNQFVGYDNPYTDAEIVEVVINYDMCIKMDVSELFDEIKANKTKIEEKYRLQALKWKEEQERKQLEELKIKYES
ncbi:hypothetical protein H6F38_14480 [Paenibacillus sp. EKM208P]|nr:hypothetical protein H6F38_14480 [Paenibacillus sp. EKM208P]